MTVTGTIRLDLTIVRADRQRGRVTSALGNAPHGASVELIVGPLIVGGEAVRLIRDYAQEHDLSVNVKGESRAVQNWVLALRTGDVLGMLL